MKTRIEDEQLKNLLQSMKLESPDADFSSRVMNRIFEEQAVLEHVKSEPLLGRGFWIILALFAGLFLSVGLLSGNGYAFEFFKDVNTEPVLTGYRSFFNHLDGLPVSIAGILFASSLLLFLERHLNSRSKALTSSD